MSFDLFLLDCKLRVPHGVDVGHHGWRYVYLFSRYFYNSVCVRILIGTLSDGKGIK